MAVNTVQHSQHNNKNETNSSTLIPQMPMASPSSSTTFSVNPTDYHLLDEVGSGSTATVYRAIYLPNNRQVAVKCLDLDRFNCNLDDIRKEAQTLSLIDHPNVVSAYCSFVVEHYLWVVMPFMAQGSCLHLMKVAYREGFEEDSIASILKETLKALEYFHRQGHIHRDVKAGNILLHDNGEVKVADFGVSACMFDSGDRQRSRNTFVGTPCWMAPEVLQPGSGYNSKADIWSFGIMALELAHGHAPFSKYPPMKVLLMTIQNAPPGLDYDRDRKFSKSFKEMVAMCLVKDQTKRPSAEKLLKHSFFKNAKPPGLSVKKLFADLPPLWNRVKSLQIKDADQLAQKKTPSAEQEALSQDTTTDSLFSKCKKNSGNLKQDKFMLQVGYNDMPQSEKISGSIVERTPSILENDMEASKTKNQPPKILRTLSGPPVQSMMLGRSLSEKGHAFERFGNENQSLGEKSNRITRQAPNLSGPLMLPNRASANSLSAPIKSSGGFRDSLDDKSKANLVQIKGRFSVTSENLEPVKGSRLRKSASVGDWMSDSKQMPTSQSTKDSANTNNPASLLIPHLQNLFQQTSIQQDLIMNLWNSLQPDEAIDASQNGKLPPLPCSPENKGSVDAAALEREKLLMAEVAELQARMISLTEELTLEKLKHEQLQQQLNNAYSKERNGEKYEVS
ncbi:hypothetical protein TanjilG_06336 [Lupinus angustifolius]|uniref:Protein kinase domain-containing protein n=1 Tax=Lupinus angustifolius TaxID=3871 RepID=A0A1J7HXP7_LUPAN|nr:hypothetical protein TanjilG_06336 [Lupinus angustifolius]